MHEADLDAARTSASEIAKAAATEANKKVEAGVTDGNGKIIPGLTSRSGKVDSLRWEPKWAKGHDLSQLIGETVRLRFQLQNANLFAFQFLNPKR